MVSYNIGTSTIYDIKTRKDQLHRVKSVKDFSSNETLKQPKLSQLNKVLYKWFTVMHSDRKPVTGPITKKAVFFKIK
jgi:hypothetical protein